MNYSKQREQIFEMLKKHLVHPDADYIYDQVRKVSPNISLATVYRNLTALTEMGRIKKILIPKGSDRYDSTLSDHYHIMCQKCGSLHDVDMEYLHHLNRDVATATGYDQVSHSLIMTGTCSSCINVDKKTNNGLKECSENEL